MYVSAEQGCTPRLARLARNHATSHSEWACMCQHTPTSQRMAHLRTHANTTQKTEAKIGTATGNKTERRTRAPSQVHLLYANIQACPTSQAATRPTPLTCQQRVLLRVALGQTIRDTDPKRPVIAPIPSRRARPRKSLKGCAHAIPFYNSHYYGAECREKVTGCSRWGITALFNTSHSKRVPYITPP
jgi:hypothetical protein